jgi:ankyrin repeat protein
MDRELVAQLIDLAVQDQPAATKLLAEHPELLGSRYIHGETPLHFCAVEGFAEGVRFLAQAGVPVNAKNEFGDTALVDAVRLGSTEIVKVLIRFGADPNVSSPGSIPLDEAISKGNVAIVEALLDSGARPDYVTDLGENIWDALRKIFERSAIERVLETRGFRRPSWKFGQEVP